MSRQIISWDPVYKLATIIGPGGHTQLQMSEGSARATADALGIEFEVRRQIVSIADGFPKESDDA